MSLHARAIGLTLDEARIVSYASPLIAFIGPLIAGPLLDHFYSKKKQATDVKFETNSCIRITLSSTILLATIFYSLLLSVPPVQRLEPRQPKVSFACSDRGASLLQERCNDELGCYHYKTEKRGEIRLTGCAFDCSSPHFDAVYIGEEGERDSMETEVKVSTSTVPQLVGSSASSGVTEAPTATAASVAMEPDLDTFFGTEASLEEDDDDNEWGSGEDGTDWVSHFRTYIRTNKDQ